MKIGRLILSIIICQLAGIIGSFFTATAWLETLNKPSFNPPNWIFGAGLDHFISIDGYLFISGLGEESELNFLWYPIDLKYPLVDIIFWFEISALSFDRNSLLMDCNFVNNHLLL